MPAGNTYAEFYNHAVLDVAASREAKRQIYNDSVYIEIKVKGDKNTSFSRPKREQDEIEYPEAWALFSKGEEVIDGTPLDAIPKLSMATLKNLQAQGILTVEDLAELEDNVVIGVSGMVDLRKRAQAYMKALEEPEKPKRKRRKRNPETGKLE